MSSPNEDALVLLSEDLQREVETVQHLRKALHDAYIVERQEGSGVKTPSAPPPPAVEIHRTIDAPTLALVKAPNYPFLLCEGAPPAYVPPPVPYDVEGEVDNMKGKVLQMQRDLVAFQESQRKSRAAKPASQDPEVAKEAMREELIDFLDGHQLFSELAWQVSSLLWFYRWVLSHSISHLWNAKDQLEFVMTENGQSLPESADAMDAALDACPFTQAVAILDNDRQSVIAQERRRLRSVSRTFRDRLPPTAITAATSCYLSSEEKYMYQEFYNQSEHLLLLLDHAMLMERSAAMGSGGAGPNASNNRSPRHSQRPSSRGSAEDSAQDARALVQQRTGTEEEARMNALAQEAFAAYSAEHEVIRSLMETIQERRRDGVQFAVSEDEYQRSRVAQIAVYGCIVSDMNLMAKQMAVAKEFMDKYEDWIRFHGFDGHDALMQMLMERSASGRWPVMSMSGAGACDGTGGPHSHFTPPTALWAQERSQSRGDGGQRAEEAPGPSAPPAVTAPPAAASSATSQRMDSQERSTGRRERQPLSLSAITISLSRATPSTPTGGRGRSPAAVADVYLAILRHADDAFAERKGVAAREGTAAESGAPLAPRLDRMWMAAAVRQTVLRLAQSRWTASWLLSAIADVEEELLSRLRQRATLERLIPSACALMVVVTELLVLSRRATSTVRGDMTEVRVALHSSTGSGDDLKRDVEFALCPVEYERWGSVLDALWFQADPSGAANGGLLLSPDATGANPALPGFQRIEKVAVPVAAAPSSAAASTPIAKQAVPVVALYYRAQTTATQTATPQLQTATSVTALLQKEALHKSTSQHMVMAQCARRYRYARAALAALFEVEAKGLLPCYACRIPECDEVPLETIMFFSNPQAASDVMGISVGLLPPAAAQLLRIFKHTELRRPSSAGAAPFGMYQTEGVNFSSIGMMVGDLLARIATACRPSLKDLAMMAETTREQANWERQNNMVPKSFVNATTQPTPMTCAAAKTRAISIQREASVPNRNSISLRRFISPLLRHMDDYLSTADFGKIAAGEGDDDIPSNGHGSAWATAAAANPFSSSQPASATARKTELSGANRTNISPSPSPSAVRPRGY